MDIYEFTQALGRQKRLLLVGFALLLAFVVALSVDFSDGVGLRSSAKYEATVDMAVVPRGFESLTQDLGANNLAGPATLFASLLASPQVALEIEEQESVSILEMEVVASGRDRFLYATVLSETPDGAVAASLGSFRWLRDRLAEPIFPAPAPAEIIALPPLLNADGQFRPVVRFDLDHALEDGTEGIWLVASTDVGDDYAFRLTDSASETPVEFSPLLSPGSTMSLVLENSVGARLDSVDVDVPPLPSDGASSYDLIVDIDRGFVRGAADSPRIDAERIALLWVPLAAQSIQADVDQLSEVSVLLLTDQPIPKSIGGRRTPLLIIALMTAGMIALVVLAVVIDSWKLQQQRQQSVLAKANPHVVPAPIPLSSDVELADRRQEES